MCVLINSWRRIGGWSSSLSSCKISVEINQQITYVIERNYQRLTATSIILIQSIVWCVNPSRLFVLVPVVSNHTLMDTEIKNPFTHPLFDSIEYVLDSTRKTKCLVFCSIVERGLEEAQLHEEAIDFQIIIMLIAQYLMIIIQFLIDIPTLLMIVFLFNLLSRSPFNSCFLIIICAIR